MPEHVLRKILPFVVQNSSSDEVKLLILDDYALFVSCRRITIWNMIDGTIRKVQLDAIRDFS